MSLSPDLRFYYDGLGKLYRLTCVSCGAELFEWSHALERRHIGNVATLTALHRCGGTDG